MSILKLSKVEADPELAVKKKHLTAKANELGLKETGPFARDGYIDGIGRKGSCQLIGCGVDELRGARIYAVGFEQIDDNGACTASLRADRDAFAREIGNLVNLQVSAHKQPKWL